MKSILSFLCSSVLALSLTACGKGNQREAANHAGLLQQALSENTPGTIPASETGCYMQATIDGKPWSASHMMPETDANSSYKLIHGENGADHINFLLWRRGIEVGEKTPFSDSQVANLSLARIPDAFFGGNSGEVEVTKRDDQWIEGRFHFTATSSNSTRKVEITEGRFRVALVPGLK